MKKVFFIGLISLLPFSTVALADDLYEEYHGGFGSKLYRGFLNKPDQYTPQPQRSLNPIIRKGLGDYDHDGMFDKFDHDADDDGMLNKFDRDLYDSKTW